MSNDPRPTPWAVGWEERPWTTDPDDAGALRAWSEAGPSAASSFWRR